MTRKLKVLGLALMAVCAMSAMVASTASGHTPADFAIEKTPATITANQKTEHRWTITGQAFTCQVVALEGTVGEPTTTSIKMSATYDECGFFNAKFTGLAVDDSEIGAKGKCWYRFDAAGSVALECNEGDVTIDAGPCVVHIPAQSFSSGVAYSTETIAADKHDLTVSFELKEITATHTDGFLCPLGGSGHNQTTALEGTSTMIAEAELDGVPLHLTHNPTVP